MYEEEINIVKHIRQQRWIIAAVKKLLSEKDASFKEEVEKQS